MKEKFVWKEDGKEPIIGQVDHKAKKIFLPCKPEDLGWSKTITQAFPVKGNSQPENTVYEIEFGGEGRAEPEQESTWGGYIP